MSKKKAKKISPENWRFDDLSADVLESMKEVCEVLSKALEQLPRDQNVFDIHAGSFPGSGSGHKAANVLVKIQSDYDGVIEVEPVNTNLTGFEELLQYRITIPDRELFTYFQDMLTYWSFQLMGRQTLRPPLPKSYQAPSPAYPPEVNAEVEKRLKESGTRTSRPGKGGQILRDEDIKTLEGGFKEGKVIKWHCSVCRTFIKDFESIEALREELQSIERGNYKKCPRHGHENSFSVRDGRIVFQNQPLPLEKVLVDKSLVDKGKGDANITEENKKTEPSK